jgi:hypothetical protein
VTQTNQYDGVRLPIGPLEAAAERMVRPVVDDDGQVAGRVRLVAEAVGVTRRTVFRWARDGLTWGAADKAACALGLHPSSVWGRDWWAA